MPPWWKIRRELIRPFRQALQIPELFFVKAASTRFYDCFLAKRKKITTGHQPVEERVAIFAMYSPTGLTEDHLHSLRYLKDCGYATIIVSNSPIEEKQRQSHQDLFHVLMERANYGYDFGAYRDGILFIEGALAQISFLALFNDSCLFPVALQDGNNWLKNTETCMEEVQAVTDNFAINKKGEASFEDPHFHYASYAIAFKSSFFQNPEFMSFWKNTKLAFSKNLIVSEGEIRLSRFIVNHAQSHGATLSSSKLFNRIRTENNEEVIEDIYNHLITTPDDHFFEKYPKLDKQATPNYHDQAKEQLLKILNRHGATYHLTYACVKYMKSIFVKKRVVPTEKIKTIPSRILANTK
jgi:lipopolysaccharide biosynthesis protein